MRIAGRVVGASAGVVAVALLVGGVARRSSAVWPFESDAAKFARLTAEVVRLGEAKDGDGCRRKAREVLELAPSNDLALYNLACCEAIAGEGAAALRELGRAIDAGYWNRKQIEIDGDLAALRDRPEFARLLERLDAAKAAWDARDPLAGVGKVAPPKSFRSLEALDDAFSDEMKTVRVDEGYLGWKVVAERETDVRRRRIAALRAFVAKHPEAADEADWRILRIEAAFPVPAPAFAADVRRFASEHPASPRLADVEMLRISTEWTAKERAGAAVGGEDWTLATADVRKVFDTWPESTGAREACLWLMRDAVARRDLPTGRRLFATLKQRAKGDTAFWDAHGMQIAPLRIALEGIGTWEAKGLAGEPLGPARFRGKVVLYQFWATWCAPCVEELPRISRLRRELGGAGFEVVGISGDDLDRKAYVAWLARHDVAWPQIHEGDGMHGDLFARFDVFAIPFDILVDRDGSVIAVDLRGDRLEAAIREAVKRGGAGS